MSEQDLLRKAREVMTNHKAPYGGLIIDLVTKEDFAGVIFLRVYRANVESFSDRQKEELGAYLVALTERVEKAIVPYQAILEGVEHDPDRSVSSEHYR